MRFPFTRLPRVLIALCVAAATLQACSHQSEEVPTPTGPPKGAEVSIAQARTWYQATFPNAPAATGKTSASASQSVTASGPNSTQLAWARAITVGQGPQQLILVPLAGDAALFAHSSHTGTRYLIITASAPNALSGHLVELLLRRTPAPVDTVALFTGLYQGYRNGRWTAPTQGDGFVLLYSANYRYLTGRQFRAGSWLPGTPWLVLQPHAAGSASRPTTGHTSTAGGGGSNLIAPIPCLDWYSGQTGEYITSTGDCDGGGVPPIYTGGGGPGGSNPPGGGGYSGPSANGGTSSPTVILNISLTPCQTAVFNNLQNLNNGMLAFIVQKFGGTTAGYNWKLQNGTLPVGTYGRTGPYDGTSGLITSTFDASKWQSASDLSVARTMLHESVHAYLLTYFASTPQYATLGYPDLIAAYGAAAAGIANANIPHHNVNGAARLVRRLSMGITAIQTEQRI